MSCMFLRLDPRYPVLWRDTTCLQIGAETPVTTLTNVSRPFEQLIGALIAGISRDELDRLAVRLGLAADEIPGFLDRIRPALITDVQRAGRRGSGWVVEGTGPTARLVGSLLHAAGMPPAGPVDSERPALVLLVAHHVIEPRRYVRWLSRDVPHLAVVYTDTGARVGPLVDPGVGPCLHCLARHAAESDPAWPALASQLLGQGAVSEREPLVSTVAGLAARVAEAYLTDGTSELAFASISFGANSLTGSRAEHRLHPDCGCRSLSGSENAPVAETLGPAVLPMTGTTATVHG
jgi:bacteriocin biosynthesis cyclodehydratase domain-containing protein